MNKETKKKLFVAASTIVGIAIATKLKRNETIAFILSSTAGSLLAEGLFEAKPTQKKRRNKRKKPHKKLRK